MTKSGVKIGGLLLVGQFLAGGVANAQVEPERSAKEIETYDLGLGPAYTQELREMYSGKAPAIRGPVTAASLAAEASLVIEGQVQRVTYTHEGAYEQPFTIIDISVTRVLKGAFDEDVVVIKQPGGPSKNGEMINVVSHAEYFVPGDGELLFLETTGDRVSIKNRFRVYDQALYSQDGFGLLRTQPGQIRLSNIRNPAETFTRIVIANEVLRKNFSRDNKEEGDHSGRPKSKMTAFAEDQILMTVDSFAEAINAP